MRYLIIGLLSWPSLLYAGAVSQLGEGDPLKLVYVEMQYLYRAGLEINQKYTNQNDPIQMMQCKGQYDFILTRARSMIGTAGQIKEPLLRDKVIDASWHAYACASCMKPVSNCDPVPENLEMIKNAILEQEEAEHANE
ncbi:hypothetical protein Q7C_238 [Methylophaga frappieri]|uniref:Secreted protein n=1 Tax=Methylophaga frappieri (strain ATCC BAA-2434 / DSM 25690 / JAM7) TaxID=754477 RepID=I1YES4_METFJ|nr:hypothetical protein [Methylophaga frappieri]AFJ01417.1 hypothetical protein Q7C_238 [Methylophaga frappieri]